MELFNSQKILDGSSVPRERDQARGGWVKGIFVNFSSLEVPTDLLLEWLDYTRSQHVVYQITRCRLNRLFIVRLDTHGSG